MIVKKERMVDFVSFSTIYFLTKKRRMWIIDFGKCDICHIRNPTYFINASKKKKEFRPYDLHYFSNLT